MSSNIPEFPVNSGPATANITPNPLSGRQRLDMALAHIQPDDNAQGASAPSALTMSELVQPVDRVNEVMSAYSVQFELSEYEGRIVTRIVDRDSQELIRQIPSEEVLRIAETLEQRQGRLVDWEV
ncbi:flagellar protein FlaG [Chromohalobacter canadensis]|uniref:flagellar protein FlaG n=1 Tax=Chromohalobacter canadensis TaxID=141389 RepID=UPI0021BFB0D6|nr:flagellar protein FlaG [Chromohalobacter canadensis]MCT8469820.1 flagellar protein FlaG [Chromohalobacter canadensis]MCT8472346.1 flagellar protein FlaG [Chromohalobacter canadensis]MCT8499542.1 flagellar protein FlaG [Chromohalobacter canadensis]